MSPPCLALPRETASITVLLFGDRMSLHRSPTTAVRAICGAACLLSAIRTGAAHADAFILRDGSCVVGEVQTRTSLSLFVRLASGKTRNIPLDSLDRRIEGDSAKCPEAGFVRPAPSGVAPPSVLPSTGPEPSNVRGSGAQAAEIPDTGKADQSHPTNPKMSPPKTKGGSAFFGGMIHLGPGAVSEPTRRVRVVWDESLTSLEEQLDLPATPDGAFPFYELVSQSLNDLGITSTSDPLAPVLKIDYDDRIEALFGPPGTKRRPGQMIVHQTSLAPTSSLGGYVVAAEVFVDDYWWGKVSAELEDASGRVIGKFRGQFAVLLGKPDASDIIRQKDAKDTYIGSSRRSIAVRLRDSMDAFTNQRFWQVWPLFLSGALQLPNAGLSIATDRDPVQWFASNGSRSDCAEALRLLEFCGVPSETPSFSILEALGTGGTRGVSKLGPAEFGALAAIVRRDPGKRHVVELLCGVADGQVTPILVELIGEFIQRGEAVEDLVKRKAATADDRRLRSHLTQDRKLLLDALASREGPGVLEAIEQAASNEPDSELRARAAVIFDTLKNRK